MDMIGSIADYSMMMSQNQLMTNVSTEVLSMTLDSFQSQADEVVKMMEASVQPYLGQNIKHMYKLDGTDLIGAVFDDGIIL